MELNEQAQELLVFNKLNNFLEEAYDFKLPFCGSIDKTLFPEIEGVDSAQKAINKGHSTRHRADTERPNCSYIMCQEKGCNHCYPQKENNPMTFLDEVLEQKEKNKKPLEELYDVMIDKIVDLVIEDVEKSEQSYLEQWANNFKDLDLQHKKANITFPTAYYSGRDNITTTNSFEGRQQDDIGIKHNENKPQLSLLFKQFPKALEAIVKCSEYGHEKYKNDDLDYLNFKRVKGGSKSYADAGLRHRTFTEKTLDEDSGLPHAWHIAWNALAELQLILENK